MSEDKSFGTISHGLRKNVHDTHFCAWRPILFFETVRLLLYFEHSFRKTNCYLEIPPPPRECLPVVVFE